MVLDRLGRDPRAAVAWARAWWWRGAGRGVSKNTNSPVQPMRRGCRRLPALILAAGAGPVGRSQVQPWGADKLCDKCMAERLGGFFESDSGGCDY